MDDKDKKMPVGTNELYSHLGVGPTTPEVEPSKPEIPVVNQKSNKLPTSIDEALAETEPEESSNSVKSGIIKDEKTNTYVVNLSKEKISSVIKKAIPYVAVFAIGVVAFIVLFTNTSISNLISSVFKSPANNSSSNQVQNTAANTSTVPQSQLLAYNAWIRSYFFDVSNPQILTPSYDYSGNGLSNYQKFLLGLNPTKQDTAGIGMTDAQALIAGIDPLTGQQMTDKQMQAVAANIDLEGLANKLALQTANQTPKVLGTSTSNISNTSVVNTSTEVTGRVGSLPPVNTSIEAEVEIPSLKLNVPLTWTSDPNNIETDLQKGLVHYPGTALPGQIGTAYISGHSSNYIWAKGKYNNVFAKLGNLKQGDSFTITLTDTQGKKDVYHYNVVSTGIYSATDQSQFANTGKSIAALSTCWPVGTSSKRLVVFGQLVQVDQQ